MLVKLIALRGKFRSGGYDYSKRRRESLAYLEQFCPDAEVYGSPWGKWAKTNHSLKALIGQAAFLKNALISKAGHLWVSDLNLCYVRNPRVASTSLSFAMLRSQYPKLKDFDISDEQINFLTDVNLRHDVSEDEKHATFFTAVRNPFSRIVSVYREFFEGPREDFIYEDYLFGVLTRDLSFEEFIQRLQLIPDILKDQHLIPQNALLRYYDRKKIYVRIFKLEDQEELSKFLSAFQLRLVSKNQSPVAYDYRRYYDNESLAIIYRLYSTDFSVFGYEQEYEDLKSFLSGNPAKI